MIEDSYKRLDELAEGFEPKLRARFMVTVRSVRDKISLSLVEALIAQGRIEDALAIAEAAALGISGAMSAQWNTHFLAAGTNTATFLADHLFVVVNFDQINQGAVSAMASNKLDMVREFVAEQRLATQQAILDGVRGGLNPREVARSFRGSIGLTQRQQAAVSNYRRLLQNSDSAALRRALRDGRFDQTVLQAVRGQKDLTSKQIETMVQRYEQRYLRYRSEVIARTEALRAAQQGSHQMYIQAIDDNLLVEEDLERKWIPGRDARVRESHSLMRGQIRGLREPFVSGNGNRLLYPGDPAAPAEDSIQCRCGVTTRIRKKPA